MKYSLIIKQEALNDLQEAFDYYEEQKKGLGIRFLNEIEESIERVQKNPLHFQIKKRVFREAVVKIFPYLIIFEINNNEIIVYQFSILGEIPKRNPNSQNVYQNPNL